NRIRGVRRAIHCHHWWVFQQDNDSGCAANRRVGRVFEAHRIVLLSWASLDGGPRRLGPPYECDPGGKNNVAIWSTRSGNRRDLVAGRQGQQWVGTFSVESLR